MPIMFLGAKLLAAVPITNTRQRPQIRVTGSLEEMAELSWGYAMCDALYLTL